MEPCKQMLENILEWAKEYEECYLTVDKELQKITWDTKKWSQPCKLKTEQKELLNSVLWINEEYEEIGYKFDQENQTVTYGDTYIQITTTGPVISFDILSSK